jgi:hypothetical protein
MALADRDLHSDSGLVRGPVAGVATIGRLIWLNSDDFRWVTGMNRIRHAYTEMHPELAAYFVASPYDDLAGALPMLGIERSTIASAGVGSILHLVQTLPGMVALIVACVFFDGGQSKHVRFVASRTTSVIRQSPFSPDRSVRSGVATVGHGVQHDLGRRTPRDDVPGRPEILSHTVCDEPRPASEVEGRSGPGTSRTRSPASGRKGGGAAHCPRRRPSKG